jgi:hypothetical protein
VQKLARENLWPNQIAGVVLDEYRKYLLIAATCGHPVSPSKMIDQVC